MAIFWSLQALAFTPSMRLSWRALIGVATAALLSLAVERARARAVGQTVGPSWPLLVALLGVSAFFGLGRTLAIAVTLVAVSWASARWLYGPRVARTPLLAVAARLLADICFVGYGVALFGADFGWEQLVPQGGWLIAAVVAVNAAWEAGRCARAGAGRTPGAIAALLAVAAAACLIMLARNLELGWPYQLGFAILCGALVSAGARAWSSPARAVLLPRAATLFRLTVYAALAAALVASAGLGWLEGPPWYQL
ncbi:hypothetical protein [Haliangium sp.]|uniref:hypothetical protein n=1 Tax=Haliangium sp. TaxID=2663208 RepID=UPI003D140B7E